MNGITVCVDYSDLLALTLPYNRHHFKEFVVVTSLTDEKTVQVAQENQAKVFQTNAFYEDGAAFNKYKALEQGLDFLGRSGLLCIMDADVLWPKHIPDFNYLKGNLYTPYRRMLRYVTLPLPQESDWNAIPYHGYMREFAGYTQIFHADDPHLGDKTPWHEIDWAHAGGGDSFFQLRWPEECKIRPPFECLHLGEDGTNWAGRVSPYVDGTRHSEYRKHNEALKVFLYGRANYPPENRFAGEKIKPQ